MGVIVGIVVFLIVLGAILGLLEKSGGSKVIRPYLGLLLIAGLIAGMGMVLGFMFRGIEDYFMIAAKGIAVFTAVILCLRLIGLVARKFLVSE
jgi:hypothetical protein